MTGSERSKEIMTLSGAQLRAAVLSWMTRAVDAFEGNPNPSENEGKHLVAEMLHRGWEGK